MRIAYWPTQVILYHPIPAGIVEVSLPHRYKSASYTACWAGGALDSHEKTRKAGLSYRTG